MNTNSFFSNFPGTTGISQQKSRDIKLRSLVSLGFEGHTDLFGPTPSRGRPYPDSKVWVCAPFSCLSDLWHGWYSNLTLPPPSFTCRMSMSDRAAQRWSLFTAPISNLMVSVPLARCGTPWERTYDSCRQHVQGSVHAEQ